MKNKSKAWLYESPAILVLAISFFVSIYLAVKNLYGVNWATPIVLLTVIVLFFIGKYYDEKHDFA